MDNSVYKYSGSSDSKVVMYGKDNFLKPLYKKYGQRFYEYRKEWDKTVNEPGYLPDFPLFLEVEPIYKCNLKCITCIHQLKRSENPSYIDETMSIETFKKICEEGKKYNTPAISINNANEGLLHKELFEFIDIASEYDFIDIFLGTNAILLNKERSLKLLNSDLSRILISIDATTKETYLKMRRADKFDQVVENTKQFYNLKKKLGKDLPLIRVSMVLTAFNEHEKDDFLNFWKEMADIVSLQRYRSPFGDYNRDDPLYPKSHQPLKSNICSNLWQRIVIRSNGDVLACCDVTNKLVVGNIKNQSIHQIWHGKKMNNFRKLHLEGKYHTIPVCHSCMK